MKSLWEEEKLLVTSNFSFSQCFLPFCVTFCNLHQTANSFSLPCLRAHCRPTCVPFVCLLSPNLCAFCVSFVAQPVCLLCVFCRPTCVPFVCLVAQPVCLLCVFCRPTCVPFVCLLSPNLCVFCFRRPIDSYTHAFSDTLCTANSYSQ